MIFQNDSISGVANSNWVITMNEAIKYVQKENSPNESLSSFLSSSIQLISDKFEQYIGKGIMAQNYIGYYDGKGYTKLFTENYPVNSISSVQYRNNPTSNWTDFYTGSASSNILNYYNYVELYSNYFPCGKKNIKIIYNAGFNTTPGDIKQCALEAVLQHYTNARSGFDRLGMKNKTTNTPNANVSESYEDIWDKHKLVLDTYRTIHI
jgi:hypothetical protein